MGYDKEPNHGKYIINEEKAKTVRMIYDMYLEGMGLRAIQFELEKRGRLTATGLTKWLCTAISRTLKNSFYCGIVQYRKQYVPDYLEQKKINNNGAVDYVIVKGKHEPIVTEEEYNEVMKRINSRTTKTTNNKIIGRRCSEDVWCRKMICCCGHKFNRVNWHNSTKEGELPQYAYQCYPFLRTGTVSSRLKKGLSIEGVCDVPMFPRWKLAV